ncbi:MAG: flagellar filament capping protein FliD [Desulfobulbaceae bacterium]|nr:flagellar filament capping protein FliD [Desulfobulbaceae bacterium]
MVGSISTLGIGSGLQLQDILEQLREVDEQVINRKQVEITDLDAKLEEYAVVKNMLLTMKGKALPLSLQSTYFDRTVSSNDEDVVTASVVDGTEAQSLSMGITNLAQKSSWVSSDGFATADTSVNVAISQYTITGQDNPADILVAANTSITVTYGTGEAAETVTVEGGGGGKSLSEVVAEINGDAISAQVTASAEQIDGKYYLYVTSDTATNSESNRVEITSTGGLTFQDDPPVAMSHFSTTGVAVALEGSQVFLAIGQSFTVNYGSGSPQDTVTVSGGATGLTLDQVVDALDDYVASGLTVQKKTINGISYLHIESTEVAADESYQISISDDSSGIGFQEGDPDDTFSYAQNGVTTLIYVPKETTLSGLATLINDDTNNPGVTASAVDTGLADTPYQLMLEADATGEDNRITISDDIQMALDMDEKQGAVAEELNAQFTLNGIDFQRQTNTFSDIVTGITLTLQNIGDAVVSVASDTTSLSTLITDMVTAYNLAVQEIQTNVAYDEDTEEFGILAGTTFRDLPYDLQNLMTRTVDVGGDTEVTTMFDLGLEFNRDGTISIDETVLSEKLSSNIDDVKGFFLGDEDTEIEGFADQVNDRLRLLTYGLGLIEGETTVAEEKIADLELQIEADTERLDKRYEILTKQFIQLDRYMNQMTSIASYLTSQFDSLSDMWGTGSN